MLLIYFLFSSSLWTTVLVCWMTGRASGVIKPSVNTAAVRWHTRQWLLLKGHKCHRDEPGGRKHGGKPRRSYPPTAAWWSTVNNIVVSGHPEYWKWWKTFGQSRLRPEPRCGSSHRSPGPPVGGRGLATHSPRTPPRSRPFASIFGFDIIANSGKNPCHAPVMELAGCRELVERCVNGSVEFRASAMQSAAIIVCVCDCSLQLALKQTLLRKMKRQKKWKSLILSLGN